MRVIGIDPGPSQSAFVFIDSETREVSVFGYEDNESFVGSLRNLYRVGEAGHLAIEKVEGRGMPVPQSAIDTQDWAGRFKEAWRRPFSEFYPRQIRIALCGTLRAKPKNIRQAIIDRYPATGGGKCPQVGTKKQPGPLFGIKEHKWAALAVAICYLDQCGGGK